MLRKLLKFAASYAAIEGVQRGILLITTPLITIYLGQQEYGLLSLSLSIVSVGGVLFNLGLTSAFSRYFFKYSGQKEQDSFIGRAIGCQLVANALSYVLLIGISFLFCLWVDIHLEWGKHVFWSLTVGFFEISLLNFFNIYKTTRNLKKFAFWFNLFFLCKTASIITYCSFNGSASSYLIAQGIIGLLFYVLIVSITSRYYRIRFNFSDLVEMLSYSISIVPIDLISFGNRMIDRWFISFLLSVEMSGIYFVGLQFGAVTTLVAMAINSAFIPLFFKEYEKKEGFTKIYMMAQSCVFIMVIFGAFVSLFMNEILVLLFEKSFHQVTSIVPIIAFNGVVLMIYFINTNVLNLSKELVKYKTVGVGVAFALNIPLNYIFLKTLGLVGAAVSTLLSYFVSTMVLGFLVKKKTEFSYSNIRMFSIVGFVMTCCILAHKFELNILLKFIVLVFISFFVFLLKGKRIFA